MKLPPLFPGTLVQRRQRFLADIDLDNGERITAFCPNTGSMLTCKKPGSPVLVSVSDNPKRKYAHTWELVKSNSVWVGINTQYPNVLVEEAIQTDNIPELTDYTAIKREVKYGENSRIDLLLQTDTQRCYVEVKNVTLAENRIAMFPDAVTTRGAKHLRELQAMARQGHRAAMVYVVQRADADVFRPADHIDVEYGKLLRIAHGAGVEILVYQTRITPQHISITHSIPFDLAVQ